MNALSNLAPRWPEVSALLDEALALPLAQRAAYCERLGSDQAELRDTVRRLLEAAVQIETGDFLQTLPRLRATADAFDAAQGDLIGPYRLIRQLGQGGMGAVWLAERSDGSLKRRVALKLPHIAWSGALSERLARERDILASLDHPNIARLYDAGVDRQGRPYLAMEHVEGRAIDLYCREQALPLRARLELLLQVCAAVAHAHSRLVVHRDLKPSNILVTAEAQVRLLDFGIAKLMEGDRAEETALTQHSGRALTLDYASPEQIRGEPLSTASDVYSLAVVAYELLAGARPYRLKRGSAAELEEAIAGADPPRASDAAAEPAMKKQLRGDLDAILNKALRKQPHQRYATMVALADDIGRHLSQRPVVAQPDALAYRARKFVLRHRIETAIAAALVIALLGGAYAQVVITVALAAGSGVALWQARSARKQATLAREQAARAEEVKKFVLSIFTDANPDGGEGHQVTAVQLLGKARERLADTPVTDAATMVELQTSIGTGLVAIGEHRQAFDVLKQAVSQAASRLPDPHPQTTAARLQLAFAAIDLGELAAAEAHLDAAERSMRQLGDMAGVANVLCARSELRRDQGEHDAALVMAAQAIAAAEAHAAGSGDQSPLIEALMVRVEMMLFVHRPGALQPARRARDLARAVHGERLNDRALEAQRCHALAQVWEGDAEAGLAELKELLAQRRRLTGELHHAVSSLQLSIGLGSESIGDVVGAIEAFGEMLRLAIARNDGKPFAMSANAQYNVGVFLAAARRFDEALDELRQSDAAYAAMATDHPMRCLTGSAIAMVLTELERYDAADAIYLTLQPSDDYDLAMINGRLGMLRSAQARHAEALALLRASADYFSRESLPRRLAPVLLRLGTALLADEQAAPALEVFEQARAILAPAHKHGSPDLADITLGLARAHLALGDGQQAMVDAQAAAAYWLSFDPGNRHTGHAHLWLARTQLAVGQSARAATALQQAAAVLLNTARPSDHELLRQTQHAFAADQRLASTTP